MKSRTVWSACCAIALLVTFLPAYHARGAAQAKEAGAKRPVLFDTDLGTDIDDAFALALILASPELDLRGVTTVGGGAEDRAWMACRFLTHVGRADVPVAFGRDPQPASPQIGWQIQYRRHPAVVWDRTAKPVKESAVELMYEKLKAEKGKVTIIAAGPLTNIARLIEEKPDCKPWVGRVVLVGAGRNVYLDPDAARKVVDSGLPLAVSMVVATDVVRLADPLLDELFAARTPLTYQVQSLYELYDIPIARLASCAAVALALPDGAAGRTLLKTEDLRLAVGAGEAGVPALVPVAEGAGGGLAVSGAATSVDTGKFMRWYVDRVKAVGEAALPEPPVNESTRVERGNLPAKVHVFEDYETDI